MALGGFTAWILSAAASSLTAWRRGASRRVLQGAWAAAFLLPLVAVGLVAPALPVSVLTPMHESFTEGALAHALGFQLHEDPWVEAMATSLPGPRGAFRRLVAVEAATLGLGAIAWFLAGWRASRQPLVGVLAGATWVLPPFGWGIALSGTATGHLVLLAGLTAWAVVEADQGDDRARWTALAAIVPLVGLMALLRPDVAIWGPALALGSWICTWPGVRRLDQRLADLVQTHGKGVALLGMSGLIAAVWGVAATLAPDDLYPLGTWRWGLWVLHPTRSFGLTLPFALGAALPVGATLLALRWMGVVARRPASVGLLAGGALFAWQGAVLAAHGHTVLDPAHAATWELWRYLMVLSPWIGALVLLGAVALRPGLRPVAAVLLLVPPFPELLGLVGLQWSVDDVHWPRLVGVRADALEEARAFLANDEGDRCWIVTRSRDWYAPEHGHLLWVALGYRDDIGLIHRIELPDDAEPAEVLSTLRRVEPWLAEQPPTCVWAWWSADCRGADDPGCDRIAALPEASPRVRLYGRPFVHPDHGPAPDLPGDIGAHALLGPEGAP